MGYERALNKKKYRDTRKKILGLLKASCIEKKLGKHVSCVRLPLKIGPDLYFLLCRPPAKVQQIDYENWTVTVKMRAALYTELADITDLWGTVDVQYNIAYDAIKNQLQFRGATIYEMDFAPKLLPLMQKAMKKKAGKLNLDLDAEQCF